jgi:hypothetical protein
MAKKQNRPPKIEIQTMNSIAEFHRVVKNYIKMKKLLTIIFSLLVLASCTVSRHTAEKRIAKYLKNYPDLIDTNTVVKSDTIRDTLTIHKHIHDTTKVNKAYSTIDSLINLLDQNCPKDTLIIKEIIHKIHNTCTAESLLKPIRIDTLGVSVMVEFYDNEMIVDIVQIKETIKKETVKTIVVPCPDCSQTLWQWFKAQPLMVGILLIPWIIILVVFCLRLLKKFS